MVSVLRDFFQLFVLPVLVKVPVRVPYAIKCTPRALLGIETHSEYIISMYEDIRVLLTVFFCMYKRIFKLAPEYVTAEKLLGSFLNMRWLYMALQARNNLMP